MNIINQAMLYLLDLMHTAVGSYGLAIILITVLIRVVLWPLNSAQTRSMKKMQELQPKLKSLQEKYKNDPQKMQEAMMKFYSENSFNPLAGCLPMIIQLPIFIGLYGALSSPHFLADTVHEQFMGINNLSATLQSHAGKPLDGTFTVLKGDTFGSDRTVKLTLSDGKVQEQDVSDTNKLIVAPGVDAKSLWHPGEPLKMTLNFSAMGLNDEDRGRIKSADVLVVNNKSRELENVKFENVNGVLTQEVPTVQGSTNLMQNIHWDVLALIVLYGILTIVYQQVMTGRQPKPAADDTTAQAMQSPAMKMMPLMFVVLMFIFPIPAGALIYLVVTTALMLIQTLWVNFSEDRKSAGKGGRPSEQIVDVKADRA